MKEHITSLVCAALMTAGFSSCDQLETGSPYHARIIGPTPAYTPAPTVQKPAAATIPAPAPAPQQQPEAAPAPAPAPRTSVSQRQPQVRQHARVLNAPRRTNGPVSQRQPIILPAQRVSSGVRY